MRKCAFAVAALGVLAGASAASAQETQIPLSPANVIGGSGSYQGDVFTGTFNATLVLDEQTGDPVEPADGPIRYWLNPDNGPQDAFIVIDLGQEYQLGRVELFNTHNRQFNDRGTGQFVISGSNDASALNSGPGTTLVSDTLTPAHIANDPIDAQSFNVTDTGSYRYLRFDAETVAVGGTPCCGANNYGLNEIRVFQVPEPASLGLLALGGLGLLARRRRGA